MADDWASKTAQRLKEREEQRRANDAHDMRKAGLLASHAPMLWESLKEMISRKASELNEAYGDTYLTVSPLVQNRQDLEVKGLGATLKLDFKPDIPAVSHVVTIHSSHPHATRQQGRGDLLLVVDRDQVWFIKKGESGTYKSVEDAAEYLLHEVVSVGLS